MIDLAQTAFSILNLAIQLARLELKKLDHPVHTANLGSTLMKIMLHREELPKPVVILYMNVLTKVVKRNKRKL